MMEKKPAQTANIIKNDSLFHTIRSNDEKVCRSFRSNYFEPLSEMPNEETDKEIIDIHNSV